jgi:hypothetical protein
MDPQFPKKLLIKALRKLIQINSQKDFLKASKKRSKSSKNFHKNLLKKAPEKAHPISHHLKRITANYIHVSQK